MAKGDREDELSKRCEEEEGRIQRRKSKKEGKKLGQGGGGLRERKGREEGREGGREGKSVPAHLED